MDDNETVQKLTNGKFPPRSIVSLHEYYLTGEIGQAENYLEWFDAMRHTNENDVVKLYINSWGGDLFTAIQFMRVMADTPATIVASVEGMCMSAATVVFLCADSFEVTPHSVFMFHNYSGLSIGKGGEMVDQLIHERKWSERLLTEIYKDFMTPSEIKSMLDNKDLWMDSEEVVKRLTQRTEKRKREANRSVREEKQDKKKQAKATIHQEEVD